MIQRTKKSSTINLKRELRCEDSRNFIVMKDVYAKEPWLLDHSNNSFFKEDEWYYFSTRTQISEKKIGRGKYSKGRSRETTTMASAAGIGG